MEAQEKAKSRNLYKKTIEEFHERKNGDENE